jgi:acetyl/propionyl-CoA carboxylase alpha subunit
LFAGEEIEARPSRDAAAPCPNIESAVRKRTSYFHQRALEVEDFVKGHYDTHFVDKHIAKILEVSRDEKTLALMASAVAKFLGEGKKKPTTETTVQDVSAWKISGRRESLRR